MTELLTGILGISAMDSIQHPLNVILILGLAIFGGTVGARIFQRLHIPQIVGYFAVGIILGPLLGVVSPQTIKTLEPFNTFALGIIGFLIGSELKKDVFVKFGKQVVAILLFEGLIAFVLVGLSSFLVMWYFCDWQTALAVGVVLGAICAATDPASTTNVLWEYKTRGPITSMLTAIVALDDALAMILYMLSVSMAAVLTGRNEVGFSTMLFNSFYEVAGSLGLGVLSALILSWIIRRLDDSEKTLLFSISMIVLNIGLAIYLHLDVILSSMAVGVTMTNLPKRRSIRSFDLIRRFSPPIYVLFFVLIGARFNISAITGQILLLVTVYLLASIFGKTIGCYLGSVYSGAVVTVRKYLGFCLYQQGTIAIALLIMAATRFEGTVRETMLSVIIIGVFVLQFVGPVFVKMAIKKAGEVGLNVTEEDLIKTYTVADVADTAVPVISTAMSMTEILKVLGDTDDFYYPVVDNSKKLIGAITMDGVRNTFTTNEINDWLIAMDIMEPIIAKTSAEVPLVQAIKQTAEMDTEHMPVVGPDDSFIGVLNIRSVRRKLSAAVLEKQRQADAMSTQT